MPRHPTRPVQGCRVVPAAVLISTKGSSTKKERAKNLHALYGNKKLYSSGLLVCCSVPLPACLLGSPAAPTPQRAQGEGRAERGPLVRRPPPFPCLPFPPPPARAPASPYNGNQILTLSYSFLCPPIDTRVLFPHPLTTRSLTPTNPFCPPALRLSMGPVSTPTQTNTTKKDTRGLAPKS